jgi:hypothetical protein
MTTESPKQLSPTEQLQANEFLKLAACAVLYGATTVVEAAVVLVAARYGPEANAILIFSLFEFGKMGLAAIAAKKCST